MGDLSKLKREAILRLKDVGRRDEISIERNTNEHKASSPLRKSFTISHQFRYDDP